MQGFENLFYVPPRQESITTGARGGAIASKIFRDLGIVDGDDENIDRYQFPDDSATTCLELQRHAIPRPIRTLIDYFVSIAGTKNDLIDSSGMFSHDNGIDVDVDRPVVVHADVHAVPVARHAYDTWKKRVTQVRPAVPVSIFHSNAGVAMLRSESNVTVGTFLGRIVGTPMTTRVNPRGNNGILTTRVKIPLIFTLDAMCVFNPSLGIPMSHDQWNSVRLRITPAYCYIGPDPLSESIPWYEHYLCTETIGNEFRYLVAADKSANLPNGPNVRLVYVFLTAYEYYIGVVASRPIVINDILVLPPDYATAPPGDIRHGVLIYEPAETEQPMRHIVQIQRMSQDI